MYPFSVCSIKHRSTGSFTETVRAQAAGTTKLKFHHTAVKKKKINFSKFREKKRSQFYQEAKKSVLSSSPFGFLVGSGGTSWNSSQFSVLFVAVSLQMIMLWMFIWRAVPLAFKTPLCKTGCSLPSERSDDVSMLKQ